MGKDDLSYVLDGIYKENDIVEVEEKHMDDLLGRFFERFELENKGGRAIAVAPRTENVLIFPEEGDKNEVTPKEPGSNKIEDRGGTYVANVSRNPDGPFEVYVLKNNNYVGSENDVEL